MNVLISPQSGIIEFNTTTAGSSLLGPLDASVRITFKNTGELVVTSYSSGTSNRFSVDGNQGRLFNVTDNMSGTLFAVNDITGIPVLQVFSEDRMEVGEYNSYALSVSGKNVGIGTNFPSEKLDVIGKAKFQQIRWSGQSGDPLSYNMGDIWYDSRNNVLRTKWKTQNNSLALGKTFEVFKATDCYGNISNAPTTGVRNNIRMLEFDQTIPETGTFIGVVPSGICLESGIIARLFWTSTATTNNALWTVAFEKMNTDLDTDSFSAISSGVSTTNSVAGTFSTGIITCTNINSLKEGDPYRLRIVRAASDVLDTLAVDAQLILIELQATL